MGMGRSGAETSIARKTLIQCQKWTSIPSATAEHRVMSYIPHLRQPPTQTESGNAVPSKISSPSMVSVGSGKGNATVTTEAYTDPFGPRQWHSTLVKLGGKDRALNEFSVERIGEEAEENLVMLHGAPSPLFQLLNIHR